MFEYIKPPLEASTARTGLQTSTVIIMERERLFGTRIIQPDTLRVNSDGTLQLYYYTNVNGSDMEPWPKDLRFTSDNHTFADYYFGILIYGTIRVTMQPHKIM